MKQTPIQKLKQKIKEKSKQIIHKWLGKRKPKSKYHWYIYQWIYDKTKPNNNEVIK